MNSTLAHRGISRAMVMGRAILSAGALAIAVGAGGCHTTAPATATTNEVQTNRLSGVVSSIVGRSLDDTHAAAQSALVNLRFTTERDAIDAFKAVMLARTADNTPVNITLRRKGDKLTEVEVHSGTFNADLANIVMNEVQNLTR